MSEITREEFDAVAAQIGALSDLVATSVVPKLDASITLLAKLPTAMTGEIAALRTSTATTFAAFDLRLDTMNDHLNGRLDGIDTALAEILSRLPENPA